MADCLADLMASNGRNACPVCGHWRTLAGDERTYARMARLPERIRAVAAGDGRRPDGTHTATGSITRNGALD